VEKANRSGIRMGDLKEWKSFEEKLTKISKSSQSKYHFEYDLEGELKKYAEYAKILDSCIVDGVNWINEQYESGKKILIEGANAAMLDLDFGTFPYVTSSTPTVGGCFTGLGISPKKLNDVIGVVKAYTTRVGEGPFPTELTGKEGNTLRESGHEFGTTTGRPRRCGWLDAVVLKYSNRINGYTAINLTKIDVLSGFDELKIGVEYSGPDGKTIPSVPASLDTLSKVVVKYETLPGWKENISKCTKFSELPVNCQKYVRRIEELVGVPVKWIGVGAARTAMIDCNNSN